MLHSAEGWGRCCRLWHDGWSGWGIGTEKATVAQCDASRAIHLYAVLIVTY